LQLQAAAACRDTTGERQHSTACCMHAGASQAMPAQSLQAGFCSVTAQQVCELWYVYTTAITLLS
jgi:hypothetical protein